MRQNMDLPSTALNIGGTQFQRVSGGTSHCVTNVSGGILIGDGLPVVLIHKVNGAVPGY